MQRTPRLGLGSKPGIIGAGSLIRDVSRHRAMQAIDRPFRFTWDFCIVWTLLLIPVFFLTRSHDIGPWYSEAALLILAPLFATFVLYGPVLLVRQMIRSGSRGWFAIRVFLSILLAAVLVFGGLLLSGVYSESRARILGFVFTAIATVYLSWRLERRERNG
jgi:hypothetical protein